MRVFAVVELGVGAVELVVELEAAGTGVELGVGAVELVELEAAFAPPCNCGVLPQTIKTTITSTACSQTAAQSWWGNSTSICVYSALNFDVANEGAVPPPPRSSFSI